MLFIGDEAIIVAFRRHTLLPLDNCLYALQATIPHLTRSSLQRCLKRHPTNSRSPWVDNHQVTSGIVHVTDTWYQWPEPPFSTHGLHTTGHDSWS